MLRRRLGTVLEHKDEDFLSKRWEDFDHSQKLSLGVWGTTWTVRDRASSHRYILQSCSKSAWTNSRLKLLELARDRCDLFVSPKYLFFRGEQVYVCSKSGGISLAEIIDSTLTFTELQAAAIIRQVVTAMQIAAEQHIEYAVKASNVFLLRIEDEVRVRLAGFGPRLRPQDRRQLQTQGGCQSLGHLAYHMLTRLPRIDTEDCAPADQMITIRTNSISIPIHTDQQLSSEFFDFIEACMSPACSLDVLLKHQFLRTGDAFLAPLVQHAEDTTLAGAAWIKARNNGDAVSAGSGGC